MIGFNAKDLQMRLRKSPILVEQALTAKKYVYVIQAVSKTLVRVYFKRLKRIGHICKRTLEVRIKKVDT